MLTFNSVPTTCTAKQITGWGYDKDLTSTVEKVKLKAQLKYLKEVESTSEQNSSRKLKYLLDFAIVFVIITKQQMDFHKELLELMGFTMVFEGSKSKDKYVQREQGTGNLYMWTVNPHDWKVACENAIKTITARLEVIDPPKKPDPARQKFARISGLTANNIVRSNALARNRFCDVLTVEPTAAAIFIRNNFGIDPRAWRGRGDSWTNLTIDALRKEQEAWKAELV